MLPSGAASGAPPPPEGMQLVQNRRLGRVAHTTGPQTRTPSDPPGSFNRLRPEAHQVQIG